MSNVVLHPTAMTLAAVEKLEALTGLRAVVTGVLRVELKPRNPTAAAAQVLRRQATVVIHGASKRRDPDNQPTPPSAA